MILYRIGVDLGGTKIEVVALSVTGEYLYQRRVETPQGDYLATLAVVVELIEGLEKSLGDQGSVGIGTPS